MSRDAIVIAVAILIAGLAVVFGPPALERFQQAQRDKSFDCAAWRVDASLLRVQESGALLGKGSPVTYEQKENLERERKKLGCSPYD